MAKNIRLPYSQIKNIQITISRPFRDDFTILPQIDPKKILPSLIDIKFVNFDLVDGDTNLFEQIVLMGLAKSKKCTRVFELGTYRGWTTCNFAINLGEKAEIFTIDLPPEDIDNTSFKLDKEDFKYVSEDKSNINSLFEDKNIVQYLGDTGKFNFTPFFQTCDLVFVDASHAYDYVLSDSSIALNLLNKNGGVVVWHDYGVWEGVTKALNLLFRTNEKFHGMKHISGTALVMLETENEG